MCLAAEHRLHCILSCSHASLILRDHTGFGWFILFLKFIFDICCWLNWVRLCVHELWDTLENCLFSGYHLDTLTDLCLKSDCKYFTWKCLLCICLSFCLSLHPSFFCWFFLYFFGSYFFCSLVGWSFLSFFLSRWLIISFFLSFFYWFFLSFFLSFFFSFFLWMVGSFFLFIFVGWFFLSFLSLFGYFFLSFFLYLLVGYFFLSLAGYLVWMLVQHVF